MEPICGVTLSLRDSVFSSECPHFSVAEKKTLLDYCMLADRNNSKGYGDAGLLVVLAHRTPNNTIPVLHANHGGWQGLFPRHD